jgi:hypothetical protein
VLLRGDLPTLTAEQLYVPPDHDQVLYAYLSYIIGDDF